MWIIDVVGVSLHAVVCTHVPSSLKADKVKLYTCTRGTYKRPCFTYPKGKPPFRLLWSFKALREGALQPPPLSFNLSHSTIFDMELSSNVHSHEVLFVSGAFKRSQWMTRCCGGLWALTGVPLNELF